MIGPLLEDLCAVDFFVFPRFFWGRFPPFIEGRSALDCWMLFRTLETGAALVDATPAVTTIHQDHSYAHDPGGAAGKLSGPETRYNRALARKRMLTRDNADWMLTPNGLRRPTHSFRRHVAWCARYAAFYPRAGWPLRAYRFAMERFVLAPAAARADAIARAAARNDLRVMLHVHVECGRHPEARRRWFPAPEPDPFFEEDVLSSLYGDAWTSIVIEEDGHALRHAFAASAIGTTGLYDIEPLVGYAGLLATPGARRSF